MAQKTEKKMEKYVQMRVPVSMRAQWYKAMKKELHDIPVKWTHGNFHITLAFINSVPQNSGVALECPMNRAFHCKGFTVAPTLEFDTLDVFTASSGSEHIINLTCSKVPEELTAIVERLQGQLRDCRYEFNEDFKLHVTLGRVAVEACEIETIREKLAKVTMPCFKEKLRMAELIDRSTHKPLTTWTFYEDREKAEEAYKKEYLRHSRNAGSNMDLCD